MMRSQVPSPSSIRPLMHDAHSSRALRLKHRRPAQSRLSPQQPLHAFCPRLRSDNIRRQPNTLWPPTSAAAPVHPNSNTSMLVDPTSVDTATGTLRALRAHGLLPVLVRELTESTPCGPDGDEGDGCDADLEEKLMRCVSRSNYVCTYYPELLHMRLANCCTPRTRRSSTLGGLHRARASWDMVRMSCEGSGTRWRR